RSHILQLEVVCWLVVRVLLYGRLLITTLLMAHLIDIHHILPLLGDAACWLFFADDIFRLETCVAKS
ncbi:MAG: hypothetical protein ACPGSM_22830, partial [Thiolinea sp.]